MYVCMYVCFYVYIGSVSMDLEFKMLTLLTDAYRCTYVCMCVHMYLCDARTCVCVCICMHVYTCIGSWHTWKAKCYVYVFIHVYVCICMYVYMYVCMYVCIYVCIRSWCTWRMKSSMYVRMYVCVSIVFLHNLQVRRQTMHMPAYIHTCTFIYTRIHTCMFILTRLTFIHETRIRVQNT
jgi:hypothetical protein